VGEKWRVGAACAAYLLQEGWQLSSAWPDEGNQAPLSASLSRKAGGSLRLPTRRFTVFNTTTTTPPSTNHSYSKKVYGG